MHRTGLLVLLGGRISSFWSRFCSLITDCLGNFGGNLEEALGGGVVDTPGRGGNVGAVIEALGGNGGGTSASSKSSLGLFLLGLLGSSSVPSVDKGGIWSSGG